MAMKQLGMQDFKSKVIKHGQVLLEHGDYQFKQGEGTSKKAHFLWEEGRACMASLGGRYGAWSS